MHLGLMFKKRSQPIITINFSARFIALAMIKQLLSPSLIDELIAFKVFSSELEHCDAGTFRYNIRTPFHGHTLQFSQNTVAFFVR